MGGVAAGSRRARRDLTAMDRWELEERLHQLEELLSDDTWVPASWQLTAPQTVILNVLAQRRLATRAALHWAIYSLDPDGGPEPKIIDVFICKLRPKLARYGIEIRTVWGQGFSLTPASRELISALRSGRVESGDERERSAA